MEQHGEQTLLRVILVGTFLMILSCKKWSWPKPVHPDQFRQPKVVWGQIMATKTALPRTRLAAKSGPTLPKVVPGWPGFGD